MAKEIFMPKLSSTMEVGTLLEWYKDEGDLIEMGEPLFEIMTDKINIEVESYDDGVVLKKYYDVDEEIPVNAVIGYIGEEGEEVPDSPPAVSGEGDDASDTQEAESEVVKEVAEPEMSADDMTTEEDGEARATPAARRVGRENNISLTSISGTGPNGRVHEQDVEDALEAGKVLATPLAEKIAKDNGVDLAQVKGTGSRGKIEKTDVLAFMKSGSQEAVPEAQERIKMKGLRKAVADKMLESTRSIPHVTLTSEVDMTKVIEMRKALLPVVEGQTGYRLSFTEVIMKTVAHTLGNHPKVNASLVGDEIVINKDVNIGLAVAVENGLIVPSVKQANKKGLAELTEMSKTLGKKARENKLKPDEMQGSTFTISNLGMYAIDGFTPIINPPETAILGVGRIVEKPVVVDGTVGVRPMMVLSLSFDHRAIDGAPAAAFLTELKENLEAPYSLLI